VVKGTQFRVSVDGRGARVNVLGGQVEVSDFKSGQYALVLPGQSANVAAQGANGLSLRGNGVLGPIQQGQPRTRPVQPLTAPKGGFAAPRGAPGQTVHAFGDLRNSHAAASGAPRIKSALGEVHLDIGKATQGLAHAATFSTAGANAAAKQTIWSNGDLLPGNGASKSYDQASSNSGAGNANGHAYGNANGNGNSNGNGNGNGNGNANGLGNGTNGNGNAFGHLKNKKI